MDLHLLLTHETETELPTMLIVITGHAVGIVRLHNHISDTLYNTDQFI